MRKLFHYAIGVLAATTLASEVARASGSIEPLQWLDFDVHLNTRHFAIPEFQADAFLREVARDDEAFNGNGDDTEAIHYYVQAPDPGDPHNIFIEAGEITARLGAHLPVLHHWRGGEGEYWLRVGFEIFAVDGAEEFGIFSGGRLAAGHIDIPVRFGHIGDNSNRNINDHNDDDLKEMAYRKCVRAASSCPYAPVP